MGDEMNDAIYGFDSETGRLKPFKVREYERERGWAAGAAPLWLILALHEAAGALGGRGPMAWAWAAACGMFAAFSLVTWWHYRDMLKKHDAARGGGR
jgi:hypothetical protein